MAKKAKVKSKKTPAKAAKKGSRYTCPECGMVLSVIEPCDTCEPREVSCCGEPMQFAC